jgi:hypothetical protein
MLPVAEPITCCKTFKLRFPDKYCCRYGHGFINICIFLIAYYFSQPGGILFLKDREGRHTCIMCYQFKPDMTSIFIYKKTAVASVITEEYFRCFLN